MQYVYLLEILECITGRNCFLHCLHTPFYIVYNVFHVFVSSFNQNELLN